MGHVGPWSSCRWHVIIGKRARYINVTQKRYVTVESDQSERSIFPLLTLGNGAVGRTICVSDSEVFTRRHNVHTVIIADRRYMRRRTVDIWATSTFYELVTWASSLARQVGTLNSLDIAALQKPRPTFIDQEFGYSPPRLCCGWDSLWAHEARARFVTRTTPPRTHWPARTRPRPVNRHLTIWLVVVLGGIPYPPW